VTNVKFRYFACGEYGSLRHRPHYHAIIFGLDFSDKKVESVTKMGHNYYGSDLLDGVWTHGHCIIGDVTPESAAYVARYTLKKAYGGDAKKWRTEHLIEPEFICMSLKPGIGAQFYHEFHSDMLPIDIMVLSNGSITKPPRYYLKLLRRTNPEEYERVMCERKLQQRLRACDNTRARRSAKELVQRAKTKLLARPLE